MVSGAMPPEPNAIGLHALNLARALSGNGHQLTVVNRGGNRSAVDEEGIRKLTVRFAPAYPFHAHVTSSLNREWVLNQIKSCEIVHYHSPLLCPFGSDDRTITTCHVRVQDLVAAERPNSARSVIEKVTMYPLQWQEKRLLDNSIGIIALNRRIERTLGNLSDRVVVRRIPHAIETSGYLATTGEKESNRVIYFGQLIERKNLETLLRAFAHFSSKKGDAKLVIIGRGNLEARLKALSRDLGQTESVEFLGYVPEYRLKKELARASIFVLPSLEEGVSSALLEAMASGIVCLASDIEANRDVITDGENGLLFPPDNHMALAELLGSCSDNEDLQANLSRRARDYVVKKHDWNVIAKDVERFYHAAVDHAASANASPVSPVRRE